MLVGPYKILNHGHVVKELEGYLDYRWLTSIVHRHDPKGLLGAHFKTLGLTTAYKHENHPDDSLFEDVKSFEDVVVRMCLKQIPEDIVATLGQDLEISRLEW